MALTNTYLTSTKNLEAILDAVKNAQAPDRFSQKFLEDLGFATKSDRLVVGLFKALGLLDDTGAPTQRYFTFLDPEQSDAMLAAGIREAYDDLFRVNKSAHKLSGPELKGKLKTLTQGKKGDAVLDKMASTFVALCDLVNFDAVPAIAELPAPAATDDVVAPSDEATLPEPRRSATSHGSSFNLTYDIHIHLPATRDEAIYDALFRSLRSHLG